MFIFSLQSPQCSQSHLIVILVLQVLLETHEQLLRAISKIVQSLLKPHGLVSPSDAGHIHRYPTGSYEKAYPNLQRSHIQGKKDEEGANKEEEDWNSQGNPDWTWKVRPGVAEVEKTKNGHQDEHRLDKGGIINQPVNI